MPDTIINDGPIAYISKITLPSGNTYYIKDEEARTEIQKIIDAAANGTHFIGVTSTELSDGDITNPVTVDGNQVTAVAGDIVILGVEGQEEGAPKEFIFNGNSWQEFGSTGSLKGLAFQNEAYGDYVPEGTISEIIFKGKESTFSGIGSTNIPITGLEFQGTQEQFSVNGVPTGVVSVSMRNLSEGDMPDYVPKGTINQPIFEGDNLTVEIDYTPEGAISAPAVSLSNAGATTIVNSISDVGALPTLTTTVQNENLTISFDAGSLPVKGVDTAVKIEDGSYTASAPIFTGTEAHLQDIKKPTGTIEPLRFTGEGTKILSNFSGNQLTATGFYTPKGTISDTVIEDQEFTVNIVGTPEGTVTTPNFIGTPAVIKVEADHLPPDEPEPEPSPDVYIKYEPVLPSSIGPDTNPRELK